MGESRGPAKYGVVRFTEGRMNRDREDKVWEFDKKIRSRREGGMVVDTEAGWSCQFVKIVVNFDGLIDHYNIPI